MPSPRHRRILLLALFLVAFLVTAAARFYVIPTLSMACGYSAKVLCSAVFVAGRNPDDVLAVDLAGGYLKPIELLTTATVDNENLSVTTESLFGLLKRTAIYRPGKGSILLPRNIDPDTLSARPTQNPAPPSFSSPDPRLTLPWPAGERVDIPNTNTPLQDTVATAFTDPDPEKPRRTRALIVVQNGRIIAEQYADNFDAQSRFPGWSMTKSITSALIAIRVHQGELSLQDTNLLPEWREQADDQRAAISLDNLLRMSSGLHFGEDYQDPLSLANKMLFRSSDTSGLAAAQPLEHQPGTHWFYSSGTSNILSRILRLSLADDSQYHTFPRRELFEPLGMTSAVLETDLAGNFVGSSFFFATARDWARFGLLYLNDGLTPDGTRLLPEGWVEYTRTPAPVAPPHLYGAHFWLRICPRDTDPKDLPPNPLPADTFHMAGHEAQYITFIPSQNLLIIRLGLTRYPETWNQEKFATEILQSLTPPPSR
jgi:CubicO group peptidase (beta-lactamase class C family)